MRKWRKRILWGFLVTLLVLTGLGIWAWVQSGEPPYLRKQLSAEALMKYRQVANDKLIGTREWAMGTQQASRIGNRPPVATDPIAPPAAEHTVTLTEDELNAMFDQWTPELMARFGQYLSEPSILVRDGRLVLMGTVKEANKVLSVHILPKLDDQGLFMLSIDKLQVGRLPIPRALWHSYTDKLVELLLPNVDSSIETAALEADGSANEQAVASMMTRLLLQSLKDQSADPVLFLPTDLKDLTRGFPVKVTKIQIDTEGEAKSISLTLKPLTAQERVQLSARVRAPYGKEPPPAISSLAVQK